MTAHHATDDRSFMQHDTSGQLGIYATSAASSLWWLVDFLCRHGPSWEVMPPILVGAASLIGAIRTYLNDKQGRKHADERHRAEMATRKEAIGKKAPTNDQNH
jgi:hypothetical protein